MKIELKSEIVNDKYTEYAISTYDIQNSDQTKVVVNYDISALSDDSYEWNIGLIYGNSGSGKSTILNALGGVKEVKFSDNSLISNFTMLEPFEAGNLLSAIGLGSIPTWLRPYKNLSTGEKYRAELAMLIAMADEGETIIIDEYTSVVDRVVAKSMSFALQKYLRANNKKVILASCHNDIMEWLTPDWILSPSKHGGAIEKCECRWQFGTRPNIELQIHRVESSAWDNFKDHHYLSQKCNSSFKYLIFTWDSKPVGMVVVKNQPSGTLKNAFGLSRTVVLPDYQGIGIGSQISEYTAKLVRGVDNKNRVFMKTIHPKLGEYRVKSPLYRETSKHGRKRRDAKNKSFMAALDRISYCHEFIGDGIGGGELILTPIKELR